MNKLNSLKQILYRKSNGFKVKTICAIIKVVSAYNPNDYKKFSFEGWTCLPINNKFVWFHRHHDKSYPWYYFGYKDLFRKNWKYIGPKKEEFEFSEYYRVKFDFIRKVISIKYYERN